MKKENNKIVSLGYNGCPMGYDDDKDMTWNREGGFLDTKYAYVCHSELNAILNYYLPSVFYTLLKILAALLTVE